MILFMFWDKNLFKNIFNCYIYYISYIIYYIYQISDANDSHKFYLYNNHKYYIIYEFSKLIILINEFHILNFSKYFKYILKY